MRIDGSTILLTGASSGIGEALAPLLAERGATVGIVARRADRLEATLERCQAHSPASRMWPADLSDLDAAEALVGTVWEAFGHVDCLINNAAMGKRKLVLDHTAEDLEQVLRTNFLSPVRMGTAMLRRMVERGSGTLVNVASGGGRFGIVHESAYCAAKFALSGWSEVAAMDLADEPVEVKLIQPGKIDTEIWIPTEGELPGVPGPSASAEECALGIAEALETDGFEFMVPADLRDHVAMKNADLDGWIELMAAIGRDKLAAP